MEFEYEGTQYSVPYSDEAIANTGRNYHIELPSGKCIQVDEWYPTYPAQPATFGEVLPIGLKIKAVQVNG